MRTVTDKIRQSMQSSSWIRKMFEKGLELKKEFGADAVCDFSLGNPDVPPPERTREVLHSLADSVVAPLGLGYCPNAGIPAVRKAMAEYLSAQQKTSLSKTVIQVLKDNGVFNDMSETNQISMF
jgi:aspartate aminotransferase